MQVLIDNYPAHSVRYMHMFPFRVKQEEASHNAESMQKIHDASELERVAEQD